jgi:4-amino-4-deoxy-L-arabinose transferase-like glycosyltransferase
MTQAAGSRSGRAASILLAILAVAALLRFARLSDLPPAHYRDVAITALDALRAASGHPCLHYVYDEGLFANLMGLGFRLLGASDWTVRLPGALMGVLTCFGVYRLGRVLGAARAGACGAFLLAVSLWHLILSRSGFRAVMLPLVLAFAMSYLVEGLRGGRRSRMLIAGCLLGLAAHTYPASRAVPLFIPLYLLAELGLERAAWARAWRGLAVFTAAAILIALPMLLHYLHHPRDFNNPARIVSIFSPRLAPGSTANYLGRNLVLTLGMFHLRGDANWRHNLSGAPLLDPLTGILFLAGLVMAAGMLRGRSAIAIDRPRGAGGLLLAWVPVMLVPNLLSVEGVPHALRSAGALPAIALLAGFGAVLAWETLDRWAGARAAAALILVAALTLLGSTAWRYFIVWGRSPEVFAAHDGAFRAAAARLRAAPPGARRLLVANGTGFPVHGRPAEVEAYLFELRDVPPEVLGAKDAGQLVLHGATAFVALVQRDARVLEVIRSLNPGAPIEELDGPGLAPESPVFRIN